MHVVALTGTVAAGKSSVSTLLRTWGATVVDADALVRALQQPGQPVMQAMVARFGNTIVDRSGQLDRRAMRRRILDDPSERSALEAIVHPAVDVERKRLLADFAQQGVALVIVDIPLLFEAADPAAYDGVIVVDAPVAERRRRLIADRSFTPREADQLIAAQLPGSVKRTAATWLIDNDADRGTLEDRTRAVWQAVQR